jgi:hypothetical protein
LSIADITKASAAGLLNGAPRYVARSPWGTLGALAVTILACTVPAGAFVLAVTVAIVLDVSPEEAERTVSAMASLASPSGLLATLASQLLSLAVVWGAAGRARMRAQVLQLERSPELATCLAGGVVVITLTGLVELALYLSIGYDPLADARWLADGLRSPLWWGVAVMAVVVAPLWEEMTFRGFLLSSLAQGRLGFWPGALVANGLWTLLHWSYSPPGLASVFVAGLALSWLLRRTGSLWVAIGAHALANTAALAFTYLFAPAA